MLLHRRNVSYISRSPANEPTRSSGKTCAATDAPEDTHHIYEMSSTHPKKEVSFTPETKPGEIDVIDIYSTSYDWLVTFRDFCKESGGFKVV